MAQTNRSIKPDLNKLVKFWQRRIRHLRGWDIQVEYGIKDDPRLEIEGCLCYGRNFYDDETMTSLIVILAPEHFGAIPEAEIEVTLLHEIAHLILELPVEVACNTIADALYKAYPKRRKP